MRARWAVSLALMMLFAGSIYASDSDAGKQVNKQPDADFLEFLGEWETTDGAWFDPLPENTNKPENSQDKEQQDEKS